MQLALLRELRQDAAQMAVPRERLQMQTKATVASSQRERNTRHASVHMPGMRNRQEIQADFRPCQGVRSDQPGSQDVRGQRQGEDLGKCP